MLKLGVIGFGRRLAGVINHNIKVINRDVQVTDVLDPDEAGVRERLTEEDRAGVAFHRSVRELVLNGKVDALCIGTRCPLHTPYAIEAAEYGLPIFLEKPVAVTMEQALRLEKAFCDSKTPVLVSFPLRVSCLCSRAHELIAAGAVGQVNHLDAVNHVTYGTTYFEAFYRDRSSTHGLFLQKATHDFDYLMHLAGAPITRIAAISSVNRVLGGSRPADLKCSACPDTRTCQQSPYNRQRCFGGEHADHFCTFSEGLGAPEDGMNEDASSALFEFANGAHGVYSQVFYTKKEGRRGVKVSGYNGSVEFDWYANELRQVEHYTPFVKTEKPLEGLGHFGGDIELARNFLDMIESGTAPRATIHDGLRSVYTCLAAKEAAETGRFVAVRQL